MADSAATGPIARIDHVDPPGMIALRGDLDDKSVAAAVKSATGIAVPDRLTAAGKGDVTLLWMAPDEVLVLCPVAAVAEQLAVLQEKLAGLHALAVDVSDMRAVFKVEGSAAREVLAKLCPADLSPDAFPPGTVRRTRLAQIAALVWLRSDDVFQVMCFGSVAAYAQEVLDGAARPGSAVGVFG